MRPIACALLVAASLAAAGTAWGSWASVPLLQLVRESDAIVVGRLTDVRALSRLPGPTAQGDTTSPPGTMSPPNDVTVFRGTIRVDSTLWSRRPNRKTVTLEWATWEGIPNIDHRELAGLDVLWLLQRDPKAASEVVYRADYPTRTIDLHVPDEVKSARSELARQAEPGPRVRSILGVLDTAVARR